MEVAASAAAPRIPKCIRTVVPTTRIPRTSLIRHLRLKVVTSNSHRNSKSNSNTIVRKVPTTSTNSLCSTTSSPNTDRRLSLSRATTRTRDPAARAITVM
uniref:(northern house mosquito) hypothetical protein n=1 Tax=Culex pipiens TaxID=7175 RepID=A0A8D8ACX1_CULPI